MRSDWKANYELDDAVVQAKKDVKLRYYQIDRKPPCGQSVDQVNAIKIQE